MPVKLGGCMGNGVEGIDIRKTGRLNFHCNILYKGIDCFFVTVC